MASRNALRIAAHGVEVAVASLAVAVAVIHTGPASVILAVLCLAGVAARLHNRSRGATRRIERFEALVSHGSDVIVVVDDTERISYVSPSVHDLLGIDDEILVGRDVSSLATTKDASRITAIVGLARDRDEASLVAEWELPHSDGSTRHVEVLIRNLSTNPDVQGVVLNLRDVTERKDLEDKLVYQALHDELTGLSNRAFLQVRVEHALTKWLLQDESFCVLVIDIDDFKNINDSLGHVAGDLVITTIAQRLSSCVRSTDSLVRLSSDEFAILLEGVSARDALVGEVADAVIDAISEPIAISGRVVSVRASIGIACATEKMRESNDLLRNADLALHAAKTGNRGSYMIFEGWMHDAVTDRLQLEEDLRGAIASEGLQLFYQPTVDMVTGRLDGAEALLRWPHPERGMVPPLEFIPIAEDSGLIVELGRWVLRQGCSELRKWHMRYPSEQPLKLNVNLSARQLAQADIVDVVRDAMEEFAIPANCLVLEITESVLTDNTPATLEKMQDLVGLGCQLAIDDFGTGYSSLSYLRQFPIGVLKIDRSFVSEVIPGEDLEQNGLVKAIIDVARTLRMKTVAEGIETAEQLGVLRAMGCDTGQGFLLARPAPAEEIRRLLESTYAQGHSLPVSTG